MTPYRTTGRCNQSTITLDNSDECDFSMIYSDCMVSTVAVEPQQQYLLLSRNRSLLKKDVKKKSRFKSSPEH